jgi:DNA polymerase-4
MDAFFVSVEELANPELKGKAVVVGGRPDQRGVVSAASYEARKFGVHSAMPLRTAYKLCPHAIFLDGHPERYRQYSERVYEVLNSFTPKLEMASIDEAYLDMSGTEKLHGPPMRAAHLLHETMAERTRLNCSIGIATTRLVAKVASDQAKPNGVLWVLPGQEANFLKPLEIRKIPGVGKVGEQALHRLGITTVGDLAKFDKMFLAEHFGKLGEALAGKSRGEDAGGWFDADIGANDAAKSISHEHTYDRDEPSIQVVETTLAKLSEMVGRRLREQALHARTLQLKLRYADFSTITRAKTLEHGTQLDGEIFAEVRALFRKAYERNRAVRLVGVHASRFEGSEQMSLLADGHDARWEKLLSAADHLRNKYGESAVSLASAFKGGFAERTHENPAGLPGKRK